MTSFRTAAHAPQASTSPGDGVTNSHRPVPRPESHIRSVWRPTIAAALALLVTGNGPAPAVTISNPALFEKSVAAAAQAVLQYGLLDDPEAQERVNRIGYEVAHHSDFDLYPFTFAVVDTPIPNAFALPAGQIFVTKGMLDLDLTDDMLAALLGHEIAHVTSEHFLKQKRRATRLNLFSSLLSVGLIAASASDRNDGYVGPYGYTRDQSATEAAAQAAMIGGMAITELIMRSYSREHEDESDEEGQRFAASAGYDPNALTMLMAKMGERIPQSKAYGYWQTHPFFDSRVVAAQARGRYLATLEPAPEEEVNAYRIGTQASLLEVAEGPSKRLDREGNPEQPETMPPAIRFLKTMALHAWPSGPAAESLRLEFLHEQRAAELERVATSRDYGRLIEAWSREMETVRSLTPETPFLAVLSQELAELRRESEELYREAIGILDRGVFETPFLEAFLSNYPDSPRTSRVALLLGTAYSRLGRGTDAVKHFLGAWESEPSREVSDDGDSPAAAARRGLHNLTPVLTRLGSLQHLALQERDPELGARAEQRLEELVGRYDDITSGSEYLERFPDGPHVEQVEARLNELADLLYKGMGLYQDLGDAAKAIARASQILIHAPLSPTAQRISDERLAEQLDA